MDPVKTEEECQPCTPVSHCHTLALSQEGRVNFLPGWTWSLPMYTTGTQTPLPSPSVFHYCKETVNWTQYYCIAKLPVPVQFLHEGTQNMPSVAVNSKEKPQPPPRTSVFNRETLDGQQKNGSAGDLTACQLRNPSYSHLQVVSEASAHSSKKPIEDALQKRELRLMKNREAARECRRKKKEYVKCLEDRVAVLENQNKTLIEELRALKDIYRHKVE